MEIWSVGLILLVLLFVLIGKVAKKLIRVILFLALFAVAAYIYFQ